MSAIDNAFIRAYTLDTAPSFTPVSGDFDDQPAPGPEARSVAVPQKAAIQQTPIATKPARRAVGPAKSVAVRQFSSPPASESAAPRRTPSVVTAESPAAIAVNPPSRSAVPSPHFRLAAFIHTTLTLDPSPIAQNIAVLEPLQPDTSAAEPNRPDTESLAEEPSTADDSEASSVLPAVAPAIVQLAPSPASPQSAAAAGKAEQETEGPRAAFEVDHFSWPDLCGKLLEQQSSQFDQLVGQLVTESALGRKVVAITGSRRGDGRTTLALALVRRLAATAVKVVVVDADFEVPQLAARLGMTLQSGWENVLTDGLPVWDGLVESLNDRLAILPLAPRPGNNSGQPTPTEFVAKHADAIRQHLEALRKEFDVVLVDAGAVKAVRPDAKPRGPLALAGSLDSAIMVSDARVTAPGRAAELQRRLLEANIIPLGIAENFCPLKP